MNRSHSRKEVLASLALLVGLTVTLQGAFVPGMAAPTAQSAQAQVAQGKAELAKGNVDNAIQILTSAAKILGETPGSCDCHLNLGKALVQKSKKAKSNSHMLLAKKELRTAIRVGRGNAISKQANAFMMANLPSTMLSPKMGEGTELIAARLGLRSSDRGVGAAPKPRVFEFYADWCEPCKLLKPVIERVKEQYGDQVEVTAINVDDKTNAEMLEQYDVSPIPTVIFLNSDGQVVGYSIGFSGEKSVQKEMKKLLPEVGNKT